LCFAIYKKVGSYQTIIRLPDSRAVVNPSTGRLDTTAVAGSAVFSALAVVLSAASQALGLNFPLIPYLQFDVGEVAIILAFFIFGPVPALVSSFVEFAGLLVYGQNLPVGPPLKLFALASTVAGLWLGTRVAARRDGISLLKLTGWTAVMGSVVRAAVMTVPNLYLILYFYGFAAIEGYLRAPFSALGIGLSDSNALVLILAFTALFNVIQLLLVMAASSFVLRVPAVSQIKIGGRTPWFASVLRPGSTAVRPVP
jgi:riboflavin transporter FmnP